MYERYIGGTHSRGICKEVRGRIRKGMELAQVCFQLEAAFSLTLQRALESELPHRVNPALRQRDSLFVYFPIQTHRECVRQETPYQSVHRWWQIAPISWRERKGKKCNFSSQTAPVKRAVLGERCGCGSRSLYRGSGRGTNTVHYTLAQTAVLFPI